MVELVVYKLLALLRRNLCILHGGLRLYPQICVIGVRRVDVLEVRAVESDVVQVVLSGIYAECSLSPAIRVVFALYAILVKPLVQGRHVLHVIHALHVNHAGQTERVAVCLDIVFGIPRGNKPVTCLEPTGRVVPYVTNVFLLLEARGHILRRGNPDFTFTCEFDKLVRAGVAAFRPEHLFAQRLRNDRLHLVAVMSKLYLRKVYFHQIHFAVFAVRLEIKHVYAVAELKPSPGNAITKLKLVRLVLVKANCINFAVRIIQVSADVIVDIYVVIFLVRPCEYSVAVVIPICLVFTALISLCLDDYLYEIP